MKIKSEKSMFRFLFIVAILCCSSFCFLPKWLAQFPWKLLLFSQWRWFMDKRRGNKITLEIKEKKNLLTLPQQTLIPSSYITVSSYRVSVQALVAIWPQYTTSGSIVFCSVWSGLAAILLPGLEGTTSRFVWLFKKACILANLWFLRHVEVSVCRLIVT